MEKLKKLKRLEVLCVYFGVIAGGSWTGKSGVRTPTPSYHHSDLQDFHKLAAKVLRQWAHLRLLLVRQ